MRYSSGRGDLVVSIHRFEFCGMSSNIMALWNTQSTKVHDVAGDGFCAVKDYVFHLICAHVAVMSSPCLFAGSPVVIQAQTG